MKIILIIVIVFINLTLSNAQKHAHKKGILDGAVWGVSNENKKELLVGANVYWANSSIGTSTNAEGIYTLKIPPIKNSKLVVSYIGYKSDTINISNKSMHQDIILYSNIKLDEVVIAERRGTAFFEKATAINSQLITGEEFHKAACCNLSESFETNASVDVSFSDAISGAKQIMLLGLAGKYIHIQMENIPAVRGLSSTYGLTYIPGPWMESIQISKGSASVKNSYESITGQINFEYLKPDTAEKFYFNQVGNQFGKTEVNIYSAHKLNKKWSTMIFAHGEYLANKVDKNKDNFIDIPLTKQYHFLNRWKYKSNKLVSQFGVSFLDESKNGGQVFYDKSKDEGTTNAYGIDIRTKRLTAFWKAGIFFKDKPYQSMAIINDFSKYEQSSIFGLNNYIGNQNNFNTNIIFSSIIGNTAHNYIAGATFTYDNYEENFNDSLFSRQEIVPGIYFEYTYKGPKKLIIVAGIRDDYHNIYGNLFTPRFHLKYKLTDKLTFRTSVGKGYRLANIFAENTSLLATSKIFVFTEELDIEEAWNYGIFLTKDIHLLGKKYSLNLDFFRTDFVNQVIVDLDKKSGMAYFYNLEGKSYANTAQAELSFEAFERFDVLMAYRINDVKSTFDGKLQKTPLVKKDKALINLSYATKWDKWQFDYIFQYNGVSRLPNNFIDQTEIEEEFSPNFIIMNFQLTRNFKRFELYGGAENLSDYIQEDAIIAYDKPFGDNFDASQVWGPLIGRKIYAGVRFKLN